MAKGLRRAGMAHVPVVVVISDFEGVGVHSWIEDRADNIVCGTSLSRQQALDYGIPRSQVRRPRQPSRRGRAYGHSLQSSMEERIKGTSAAGGGGGACWRKGAVAGKELGFSPRYHLFLLVNLSSCP